MTDRLISETELAEFNSLCLGTRSTQDLIVGPVEKGVPTPYSGYPFAEMSIGDSFSVKRKDADNNSLTVTEFHSLRQKVYSAERYHKQKYGLEGRFQIKSHDNGLRVWRIA